MRTLILLLALLPLTSGAVEITYPGEWITDPSMKPRPVVHSAVVVSEYVTIVPAIPMTDATDTSGGRHCFYMASINLGLKAMISSRPMVVGDFYEWPELIDFIILVHQEMKKDGGAERLSALCGEKAAALDGAQKNRM